MDQKKILVADDEAGVRRFFEKLLPPPEYQVGGAEDGREALEKLRCNEYDMLILDLVLPGVDGMEVFRRVRKDHPKMPVLVITGYPSEETTRESVEWECIDYITKPFDADEVLCVIRDTFAARACRLRNGCTTVAED